MKLSEKGLGKLYNSKACYYDPDTEDEVVALSYFEHVFEFEPDDFKDIVALTIEEAKHLLSIVMDSAHDHCITQEETDVFYKFVKRINKAEGK